MKHFNTAMLAALLCGAAQGQVNTTTISANNYIWSQNTNGIMFHNAQLGAGGFEAPFASGIYSIFAHSFIIAGQTGDGEIRSHYQTFCQDLNNESCESVYGPLKIGAEQNIESEIVDFNHVWYVEANQITDQISYFDCLEDPNCDESTEFPAYTIPDDIINWPAHGNTDLGFAENLAPFVDRDGDGQYDANSGDYPNLCGDFMTYFIHNDVGTDETSYSETPLGVEIHTTIYGYLGAGDAFDNTLFVRHKVINRSDDDYVDVYMGNFTDFDLGNPSDDRIATDVSRSMYYVYNGGANDAPSSAGPGYGTDLPAMAVRYLGGALLPADGADNEHDYDGYTSYANAGAGWNDGIEDNERQALNSTMTFSLDLGSQTGAPVTPVQHYYFLQGIWGNGVSMTYGEIGYNTANGTVARYIFDGVSDPYFAGTGGVDPEYTNPNGWTEEGEALVPSDRRMIAGSGPFDLPSGTSQTLDYAMIFARDSFEEEETVIETLENYADAIVGMECPVQPDITTGIDDVAKELEFTMFPNPASDQVTIRLGESHGQTRVEVLDLSSRVIQQTVFTNTHQMTVSLDMAAGQYLLRISTDDRVGVKKLTKF